MFPYSSNFRAGAAFGRTGVEQDAVRGQVGSTPPTSTVAVTVWPPRPFVSTVIEEVPWPLVIVPAETVQLYVGVTCGVPCVKFAVKVIELPSETSDGQVTFTVGHTRFGTEAVQLAIVTVVVDEVIHPQPSSTSTDAVYVPGPSPLRSQVTFAPSPVTRPPVTVYE